MGILRSISEKLAVHRRRLRKRRLTPYTFGAYLRECGMQVGEGCFIESMELDVGIEPYLVKIGNRVRIGRGVAFLTHDGAAWVFRHSVPDLQVYGPIAIDDGCVIGRGAILCPGIHVGRNAVIAPGALVISDVAPGTMVSGVPARSINFMQASGYLHD